MIVWLKKALQYKIWKSIFFFLNEIIVIKNHLSLIFSATEGARYIFYSECFHHLKLVSLNHFISLFSNRICIEKNIYIYMYTLVYIFFSNTNFVRKQGNKMIQGNKFQKMKTIWIKYNILTSSSSHLYNARTFQIFSSGHLWRTRNNLILLI